MAQMNLSVFRHVKNTKQFTRWIGKRFIAGKVLRESRPPVQKPKPFPYREKPYMLWHTFDKTIKRIDENSKIIVVDGPLASEKTKFAKALAEEFDMLHIPEANMNMYYIDDYGFDFRLMNPYLPKSVQAFDVPDFLRNPYDRRCFSLQKDLFTIRYQLYIDALAHLFSTGQGVVLERSPYTDIVFTKSLHRFGHYTNEFMKYYMSVMEAALPDIKRPHLIIYLDIPHEEVYKRIQKRNRPFEVNSEVLTRPFLEYFESEYKRVLNKMSLHSEVMIYDWTNSGDIEVIVEDIEALDLDNYVPFEKRLFDWYIYDDDEWDSCRRKYCNRVKMLLSNIDNVFDSDVPEVYSVSADVIEMETVLSERHPVKYSSGFNPELGDKVWFKWPKLYQRPALPFHEHNYDSIKN